MSDEQDLEGMLFDDIVSKWGNEQLPTYIGSAKIARELGDIGISEAMTISERMFNDRREELAEMGYDINDSPPSPPIYQG